MSNKLKHSTAYNNNGSGKVGSVLVVGGGIAGIQAALDCANSGFKVYLMEEQPAIGGNMARLDKTFPTNDCAMCMLSPKVVETGRHHNIEIISLAHLSSVKGKSGCFTVTIRKNARYVNEEKCNGCGDCERACPVSQDNIYDENLSTRKAIYRLYPQAIPNIYSIDKKGISPCRTSCPTGVNVHGYVALIAQRKFKEALDLIRDNNPFAAACGTVCTHPCELACHRAKVDSPISICFLKRFLLEHVKDNTPPPPLKSRPEKVAIIGAGPTGLSCAFLLQRMGYKTTVFESSSSAGGMLKSAIPEFRLPKHLIERDIQYILNTGVKLKLNTSIGTDISFSELQENYSAVMIAIGAPEARKLKIPGLIDDTVDGVLEGINFLMDVKEGRVASTGKNVAIIGGGNTAMDAARTAKRLKAENVTIIYRRSRKEMPAIPEELELAIHEGIDVIYLAAPVKAVVADGKLQTLECIKMELGEKDADGRCKPVQIAGSEFAIPVDTVISAIGQYTRFNFVPADVKRTDSGAIVFDENTMATTVPGIFTGGDAATGPSVLIEAVAAGRRSAISIDRYIQKKELIPIPLVPTGPTAEFPEKKWPKKERIKLFDEATGEAAENLEELAVQEAQRCLNCGICSECMECVKACKPEAVEHDMTEKNRELTVGAVILTCGYDTFDAKRKSEYGFGIYSNVVTSVQFERILSASGPYKGHLQRPGDGKTPKKIAWIQCIGSRDATINNNYCSSVCCMYATKQTIIAKEHEHSVEPTIFFTDMRAFGKGFEGFVNNAKDKYGVRFVRSQVASLKENPENQNLIIRYTDAASDKKIVEEEFDMVVLSVGLVPQHSSKELAEVSGIGCNEFGFANSKPFITAESDRKGIFVSGVMNGPKDIPETVVQSSAAAALCGELLAPVRGTEVEHKKYPEEKDITGKNVRIGVFICHCGSNIASVIDVESVAAYAKKLGGVVYAKNILYACSQDSQELMKETIKKEDLNRVIVASCTPRTHEPLFRETLREAGLNEYMFEMVNIREQCSWVHQQQHDQANEKAKALVRGGVGKAHMLEPLKLSKVGVTKAALVIGGGMSGITAALSLSGQGFDVYLVEKEEKLGGNLCHIKHNLKGYDWQNYLRYAAEEIESRENIKLYLNTEVDEVAGFVGNFTTKLKGHSDKIKNGVIIVATGGDEWKPDNFMYGKNSNVITQRELETKLNEDFSAKKIVMIQCVGSRNDEREYCSRICCGEAIKNALALKQRDSDMQIYILYRDIRTYEFKEEYYQRVRDMGVRFIHFPDDKYPTVEEKDKGLTVTVYDDVLCENIELSADMLVLSAATVPPEKGNKGLAALLKVPVDKDGFFMEAHIKLRPVDFANAGVFVCGLAHSPKYTEENISQALAAAGRAACVLSKDFLEVGGIIAGVNPDKCASCLTCVRECVYDAPFINADGKAEIEAAKCQGCGNCAAACPAKAIQLTTFTDEQELSLVRSILDKEESSIEFTDAVAT
ncbi:FAD-dependent oxidoreductase [Verrucomicrobiota bacterium]